MNDRETFLAAIRDKPDDDLPKLAFADWLGEQGLTDEESYWRGGDAVPDELDGFDWRESFGYAGEPDTCAPYQGWEAKEISTAVPGSDVPTTPFSRKDVKRVIASLEGEHDGPTWLCVGELHDGRFFALSAGCDYTGWD